jgi:uncharacterized protein
MRKITFLLLILFFSQTVFALNVPKLKGRINDYAGVLINTEEAKLEQILAEAESKTSSQVVLLTIPSLEGENLEDFSMRVVEAWQIGQKEFDNGVLLLIAMKEKEIRIEVGYGLESILTDAKSGYIIRNFIVPEFKKNNFFQGITSGLAAITGIISEEFVITDEELAKYNKQEKQGRKAQIPVGLIVFIFMMLFGGLGRRRRGGLLPLIFLGSALGGRSSRSGFGGGFGGFSGGGGSFGGGGASGGW